MEVTKENLHDIAVAFDQMVQTPGWSYLEQLVDETRKNQALEALTDNKLPSAEDAAYISGVLYGMLEVMAIVTRTMAASKAAKDVDEDRRELLRSRGQERLFSRGGI